MRLLQRQVYSPALVDLDDLGLDLVLNVQDISDVLHEAVGQLGNMYHPLAPVLRYSHKSSVRHYLFYGAVYDFPCAQFYWKVFVRIGLSHVKMYSLLILKCYTQRHSGFAPSASRLIKYSPLAFP